MNHLYLLCKPYLLTNQQYVDRLDSLPSSSRDIQTLQEAKDYWVKHFETGSFHRIECKYGKKKYVFQVKFVRNHAYTEDIHNTGHDESRIFSKERAQALDNIWKVLQNPDAINESDSGRGYRQFDRRIVEVESTLYGRVVLAPKPNAIDLKTNQCTHFEFVSWHTKEEHKWKKAVQSAHLNHISPIKKAP